MAPESDAPPFAVEELRDAFARGQLLLVYQPIFDLQTSAFIGVEALIRWRHPRLGILGPKTFIKTLEESDLVRPVGRWILETACAQGAVWHDSGYRFRVSVNVSGSQWATAALIDDVRSVLETTRFDPSLLVLEVSRSTLHADPGAAEQLGRLAALGVHRAVDDFVPDEAELEELSRLGVDVVKIDRAFVSGRAGDYDEDAVAGLVRRAEAHGMQVIAAGIEDPAQRELLARERVGSGQGFLFSEPREAAEIDEFLEDFAIFSGKPL